MEPVAVIKMAVELVGAAKTVIDGLGSALEAFERSCVIEVDNLTAESLEVGPHSHESGAFGQGPMRIGPFDHALMSSHSTAIAQGAVGSFSFTGRDLNLTADFGNPFIGSNRIDGRVSGGRAGEFQVTTTAGSGDRGALFRSVLLTPLQDNWRFCGRCHGLFFNGPEQQNHRCAAGSFHVPLGFNFVLPHSISEGPRIQSNWRFCGRCHGMFFNGPDRRNHRCPAGDLHDPLGLVFGLPHDLGETRSLQSNWRFCAKCHGMFFNGPDRNNHRCPAGGLHDPQGFLFALPHGS